MLKIISVTIFFSSLLSRSGYRSRASRFGWSLP